MDENKTSECPVPKGTLLIIGGSENKGEDKAREKETPENFERLEILKSFVKLIGKQDPVIEVFTTATGSGEESFNDYKKVFKELKAPLRQLAWI